MWSRLPAKRAKTSIQMEEEERSQMNERTGEETNELVDGGKYAGRR